MKLKHLALAISIVVLTACGAQAPAAEPTPPVSGAAATSMPSASASAGATADTSAPSSGGAAMELTGIKWQLAEYGPVDAPIPAASTPATLTFGNDGQVSGSGGCNGFGGAYQAAADTISFGQIPSTEMACADNAVTQQESAVLGALMGDVRYEIVDGTLRLHYGDNNALVFIKSA